MKKSLVIGLLILAVAALVMILTRGNCEVNLLGFEWKTRTSIVLLVTMMAGVTSGVLLK